MAFDEPCDGIGGAVRIRLRLAIGEYGSAATGKIRGGEARRKRQRRHGLALERGELLVDALGGLIVGALPTDRNQEGQLPECLCECLFGVEQQREMFGRGAAGVGHVHMRIGAIGDQRIGVFDHFGRHVGMKIETDDQRQVLADDPAHTRKNLAFAIVEMLGHHRAMQVEIDGVELARGGDAVGDDLRDALEGVFRHMRRRRRAAGHGRHQIPALRFGRFDEAGEADIDAAHDLQHVGAEGHRRPAAAMHERLVGRLGGSERIGFVQEAADGNAGHDAYSTQSGDGCQSGEAAVSPNATGRKFAKSHPRPGAASSSARV